MDFLRPAGWAEALAAKAEHPTAAPIAGGTDIMVGIGFDHRRPDCLPDPHRIGEPSEREGGEDGGTVRLGPSVPYTQIMGNLRTEPPGLAPASHTVASPRIRHRGGVGGNLGTASPAGGAHPALPAAGDQAGAGSARGSRLTPVDPFRTGAERDAPAADGLIESAHPKAAGGPRRTPVRPEHLPGTPGERPGP